MKKFQLLKWTAEVREKELQFLFFNGHSVDLLDDSNPTVIFETESESEAYNYLEKESELLCIHIFNHCGLKFANVDCLMLPVDSPEGFKPKPRLIAQNETHEFYEEPQTHTIIKVNKRTGEAVDLQKTREQLFK